MDWMVNGIFTSDCAIFRYGYFRRSCVTFSLLCVTPSLPFAICDAPSVVSMCAPALRRGSIICSISSQSQWNDIMLKDTAHRCAIGIYFCIQVSHFVHTFEIMAIRHRLLYTPCPHCQQYIWMWIFRIYTKPNGKKQRKATHYGSVE